MVSPACSVTSYPLEAVIILNCKCMAWGLLVYVLKACPFSRASYVIIWIFGLLRTGPSGLPFTIPCRHVCRHASVLRVNVTVQTAFKTFISIHSSAGRKLLRPDLVIAAFGLHWLVRSATCAFRRLYFDIYVALMTIFSTFALVNSRTIFVSKYYTVLDNNGGNIVCG